MKKSTEIFEPIVEEWDITYEHAPGPIAGEFFRTLKDEARLVGRYCPRCERVLLPPRAFCDRDYADTTAWVDVGNDGILETFTVVYQKFKGLPDPPYCIGYATLEGADTAILNFIRGVDLTDVDGISKKLAVGTPVSVRFRPRSERKGRVLDFWFEVVKGHGE